MGSSVSVVISGAGATYNGTYTAFGGPTSYFMSLPGGGLTDSITFFCPGGGDPWKINVAISPGSTVYSPTSQTNAPALNVVYNPVDFSAGGGSSTGTVTVS
jgi:hypothetical protein